MSTTDSNPEVPTCDTDELLAQVGHMNVLAISGGRVARRQDGIILPVRYGYSVEITLQWNDTYTVRRLFTRGGRVHVKGVREQVYCDEVGEIAYQASCYHEEF